MLQSFIEPILRLRDTSPGAEDFFRLVGRSLVVPEDIIRKICLRHLEPLLNLLFDTLAEALLHLSRDCLFWRLNFALGTMNHAVSMGPRPSLRPCRRPSISPP